MGGGGLALVSQHELVSLHLRRFLLAPDGGHLGMQLRLHRLGLLELAAEEAPLHNTNTTKKSDKKAGPVSWPGKKILYRSHVRLPATRTFHTVAESGGVEYV